jgi:hypothetical protein
MFRRISRRMVVSELAGRASVAGAVVYASVLTGVASAAAALPYMKARRVNMAIPPLL